MSFLGKNQLKANNAVLTPGTSNEEARWSSSLFRRAECPACQSRPTTTSTRGTPVNLATEIPAT